MKILSKVTSVSVGLALFIALFLTVIDIQAFNKDFYWKEYEKLEHVEVMEMNMEDLKSVTVLLFDYVKGKTDSLSIDVEVSGEKMQMFNEKEILHMIDVKVLYQDAMLVKNLLFGFIFLSSAVFIYKKRKEAVYELATGVLDVAKGLGTILAVLAIYAWLDFNDFWLKFHYIFFTNDLFLLDPRTDRLIQLVPSQFFFDLVAEIAIIYFFVCLFVVLIARKIRRYTR